MKEKKSSLNLITTLTIGVIAVALSGYSLYKSTRPQVGVINFATVQKTAKAYIDAANYQRKYDEKVEAIIMKDKDFIQLQEEGKKLEAKQNLLSKEELARQSAALQARALKMNERYRASFERNALASQIALKTLEKDIADAIEATSQKTGAKILLPVNTILYAAEKADFTEEFVKELDKRVQTVNYPDPATLQ